MKESAILVQRFGVHTIVFPSAMVAYQGYYSIAALWEQVKNRQCSGRFRTLSSGARQEPAKPAGGVPATSRVQKHKERPPAQTCADRGSALRGLRCPPRHVHDEAGRVTAASTNSVTETGIRTVNKRLESGPLPEHKRGRGREVPAPASKQAQLFRCARLVGRHARRDAVPTAQVVEHLR